jgi:uncharacterized lipoprotein
MAYLRKEKETVEIDYPLTKVWAAIPKAVDSLEWTVEQVDNATHSMTVKTKAAFMSYKSVLSIGAVSVDEKTAKVTIVAETPVTTITSVADFGRTAERIHLFLAALSRELNSRKKT